MAKDKYDGKKIEHGKHQYTGAQIDVSGLDADAKGELVKYALSKTAYSVGGKNAIDPSGSIVGTLFQGVDRNLVGVSSMNGDEIAAFEAKYPTIKEQVDAWIVWKQS